MFKGIEIGETVGSGNEIEAAIRGAVNRSTRGLSETTLVENPTLGYREGMRHEVRPSAAWRMPISEYVRYLQAIRRSEGTVKLRSYHLRVLSNAFRNRSPYSLVEADMIEFLAILGRHTSANTARSYQMSYRGFYRHALQHGLIQTNPLEYVDAIVGKKGKPRPADVGSVTAAIGNASPRVRLMLQLAITAGLRREEIARVHTRDVRRSANGWVLVVPSGKGDKTRNVPLSDLLAGRIQDLPEGWAFPSSKGINQHILAARVGELMGEVLQPYKETPHKLRHRFATTAFAAGGNLIAVRNLLGHESVATTEIYTEAPDDAERIAANAAAAMFL